MPMSGAAIPEWKDAPGEPPLPDASVDAQVNFQVIEHRDRSDSFASARQ